jgi:hypothetical protein
MSTSGLPEQTELHLATLRKLINPGLYTAALENSPLIDLAVVRARAGENARRSVRARVFIEVLEEVVDTRLKGSDRAAARILFAMGEWTGRPVQERHHEVARLRNRRWTWERNYRKEPLTRDLTMVLLALYRLSDAADADALVAAEAVGGPEYHNILSRQLLHRLGRRRTAYPLDMSLAELHEAGLFVEAGLVRYHERATRRGSCSIEDIIEALRAGRSVLLLGEPGSGKTLTLYETARRGAQRGLLPITLRARDHRELLTAPVRGEIGAAASSVLLVDAIDEAVEPITDRPAAIDTLAELFAVRPSLFTSRLRDYEDRLSVQLQELEFDEVYLLQPWAVDKEFKEYLQRLTRAGLVDGPQLYEAVVASEQLSRLVTRPLYARMLTFIGERLAPNVSEPAALYGEYLSKLATVTDAATHPAPGALAIWQQAAWLVYSSGHQSGDMISMRELREALLSDHGEPGLRRVLDQLIDTRSVQGRELGEFLHYSFYEYLVAKHVGDLLAGQTATGAVAVVLSNDLTREIRHHLIGRLRLAPHPFLKTRLLDVYRTARRSPDLTARGRLIACNLVVYLLSRVVDDSEAALTGLLNEEDRSFLREAILWALCHRGSASALELFLHDIDSDPAWRSECRGYVLYYYGDLGKEEGPPYLDNPPYRPCTNSYRRVIVMFGQSDFTERVRAERRAIDLFTLLDLIRARSLAIPPADIRILQTVADSLRRDGIAASVVARIQEMIDSLVSEI